MNNRAKPLRVAVAGTGWRAEFFLRVCRALPEQFALCGILCHSEEGRKRAEKWNAPVTNDWETLFAQNPDFVAVSVAGDATPDMLLRLRDRGVPALCETFTVKDAETLNGLYARLKDAKIQFAEQYQFQPLHAARLKLIQTGVLGDVFYARLSIPTRHHPASLVRLYLSAGFRLPVITAKSFSHDVLAGPNRAGDPQGENMFTARHEMVLFDYGDKQAVNDFEDMQHRSFMRANEVLLRGPRGEIANENATYMMDELTPCSLTLSRVMAGAGADLQGLFLRGVSAGSMGWLYQNPFMPARLYDDELAVASCMLGMAKYIETGEAFYGVKEQFTDMYFAQMTERALKTGEPVQTERQSWMG